MAGVILEIEGGGAGLVLGGELVGRVSWSVTKAPKEATVRLIWFTSGKGTIDAFTVSAESFDSPQREDQRTFRFALPSGPFSCSGRLISIVWAVEAVVEPGSHVERVDFVLSPSGEEIELNECEPTVEQ